jgi:hypothetical protein
VLAQVRNHMEELRHYDWLVTVDFRCICWRKLSDRSIEEVAQLDRRMGSLGCADAAIVIFFQRYY